MEDNIHKNVVNLMKKTEVGAGPLSLSENAVPIPKKKMRVVCYEGDDIVSEFETPPTSIRDPLLEFTNSQGERLRLEKVDVPPPPSQITSHLTAAREAIKNKIGYGKKSGETDDKLIDDLRFKAVMENLKEEPITCLYKDGNTIRVFWNEEERMMGYNDGIMQPGSRMTQGSNLYKCKTGSCWVMAQSFKKKYCRGHFSHQFYIIRDLNALKTSLYCFNPKYAKNKGYSNSDFKEMVERMEEQYKSFCNHFKNQTDMKIQKDYFWEVQTDDVLKGQGSAHKTVAISMMIMLQNSVCSDKDKVNLINQQIVFVKAVNVYENGFFPKLMDILEANKFRFRLTSENKSTTVVAESLLPKESFKNLPLVYQGKDEDGRIYIGEKWGNANIRASEGSTSHDILKKTALSEFPKENRTRLYQFQHPEIDKVKMVKRDSSKTPAQKIIFDKMKEEASKMESLGQMACLIGKMLGAQINGHPIKLLNQKFSHFDDGFKKKEFEDFFGYFFGCGVEVDIPVFVKDKSGKVVWNC